MSSSPNPSMSRFLKSFTESPDHHIRFNFSPKKYLLRENLINSVQTHQESQRFSASNSSREDGCSRSRCFCSIVAWALSMQMILTSLNSEPCSLCKNFTGQSSELTWFEIVAAPHCRSSYNSVQYNGTIIKTD